MSAFSIELIKMVLVSRDAAYGTFLISGIILAHKKSDWVCVCVCILISY